MEQVQNNKKKKAHAISEYSDVNSSLLHLLLGSFSSTNCAFPIANAKHKSMHLQTQPHHTNPFY